MPNNHMHSDRKKRLSFVAPIFASAGLGVSREATNNDIGETMPVISMFYGVIILMFFFDNKKHHRPHIHAQYAEHEAVIAIDDGEVLEGTLPKPKMRLVQAWVEIHRDELMANWKLAIEGQPAFKIDPLK